MRDIVSCEDRLKSMIIIDKQDSPQKINKVLKSEILFVLKNYFDVSAEDVNLEININDFGRYTITITADARNMRIAHVFSK